MTALVARLPLQELLMSSSQRSSRRTSARLQGKDATTNDENGAPRQDDAVNNVGSKSGARKRKLTYEEEDDGFMFSRVKKKRQKEPPIPEPIPEEDAMPAPKAKTASRAAPSPPDAPQMASSSGPAMESAEQESVGAKPKRGKKKMSFSTPAADEKQPTRKSRRLSPEAQDATPKARTRRKDEIDSTTGDNEVPQASDSRPEIAISANVTADGTKQPEDSQNEQPERHSGTKIALPFADTPVIRRNKEMRENKGKKGERRSSLSLRGRRASSLIETGSSNALPHNEVEVSDFYKHIEAEGLPEPRRMRQLLTWCATRSLDQKPMGASFEVSSAIAAARVIQDELLKDLGNKSELSDWFSREDNTAPSENLPERPNPKNIQNTEKIAELEQQIERLKLERDALEHLLKPPTKRPSTNSSQLDTSLLSAEDIAVLEQLQSQQSSNVGSRVEQIFEKLEPTVDAFADGVHRVAQYRDAADNVASRVLSIAAEKLADRENEGRRKAQPERDRSPRRDLGNVLRGLSRIDQ